MPRVYYNHYNVLFTVLFLSCIGFQVGVVKEQANCGGGGPPEALCHWLLRQELTIQIQIPAVRAPSLMLLFYIWSINIVLCSMDELLSFSVTAQMWEGYVLVALLPRGNLLLQNSRKGLVLSKISYCRAEKKSDKICKWVHSVQDQRVFELPEAVAGWIYGQHAISHLAGSSHSEVRL